MSDFKPPLNLTVNGVLYHLDYYNYSCDNSSVKAYYFIAFEYENCGYQSSIIREFTLIK